MDRNASQTRLGEWQFEHHNHHHYSSQAPTSSITYTQSYPPPPSAPPPLQFPSSDPFQASRDPFMPASQGWREGSGRAWHSSSSSQGHAMPNGHPQHTPPPQPSQPLPPPPPTNGVASMSLPYDPSRRRSLGASSSPRPHTQGHPESASQQQPPPSFPPRHMPPPPSPPQLPSSASFSGSAPRGPPTSSPFGGLRDLASYSSHRPAGGMSISSILGATTNEEKKAHTSPSNSTPSRSMPPPSPGRARSSSMREGLGRATSPPRSIFRDQQHKLERTASSEPQREGLFASPSFPRESLNNFRAFQPVPAHQEARQALNGHTPPGRPSSQPAEHVDFRRVGDVPSREAAPSDVGFRLSTFRPFGEAPRRPTSHDATPTTSRHEVQTARQNGHAPAPLSQSAERGIFSSPRLERERAHTGPMRFPPTSTFSTPLREEQAGLFRPAAVFPPAAPSEPPPRESIETASRGPFHATPAAAERPASPVSPRPNPSIFNNSSKSYNGLIGGVAGAARPPLPFEEHQSRPVEATQQQQQQLRKESDPSLHRSILNISPEVNRLRGRNSPLPQAVQGAQPRLVGPGGDNPSVKMEFGRVFSGLGLGSGAGTHANANGNGAVTPSRLTPVRQVAAGEGEEGGGEDHEGRRVGRGKRGGRRGREMEEDAGRMNGGRDTPELGLRGAKRVKTNHHHVTPTAPVPPSHHHHHHVHYPHHHHHHHQPPPQQQQQPGEASSSVTAMPNPFTTLRFPSNPPATTTNALLPAQHQPPQPQPQPPHHHHHHPHAHPGHHHHHHPPPSSRPVPAAPAAPPAPKPTLTISNTALLASVAKKPRRHLGSQLYSASLSVSAPSSSSSRYAGSAVAGLDSSFGGDDHVRVEGKPIPLFKNLRGKASAEGGTFLVRVPRGYFSPSFSSSSSQHRSKGKGGGKDGAPRGGEFAWFERICRERRVWGSEVYTDDSDVVAAAVHSGWIRGPFALSSSFSSSRDGEGVVVSDDEADEEEMVNGDVPTALELDVDGEGPGKPKRPLRVPEDSDVHLTLLILPPLREYAASCRHGVFSRRWDGSHDGLSFMISGVRFVDEGGEGKMVERSARGRKERLRGEEIVRREALLLFQE